MKAARIIFGVIYLGGAAANVLLVIINSPESYSSFADEALIFFYQQAWAKIAVPNITLFVTLLILFEITLGVFFLIGRRFLKTALVLGIIFCLITVPFGLKMLSSNLALGLIQVFLLWLILRKRKDTSTIQESH